MKVSCKTFLKCWVITETHKTFCFPLYLEKVENEVKCLESKSKTMVTGHDAAKFWFPSNFLITYYQWDLMMVVIFALQTCDCFKNVDVGLHFQGHLLQKLDDQIQKRSLWWKLDENWLNDVEDIQCLCVWVCVCVCVFVHLHMYVHVREHVILHVSECVCLGMCTWVRTCVSARAWVSACVHMLVCVCMYGCVLVPVYDCLGAFMCSRISSCIHVSVCIRASMSGETVTPDSSSNITITDCHKISFFLFKYRPNSC